jgi:hypothetical protein
MQKKQLAGHWKKQIFLISMGLILLGPALSLAGIVSLPQTGQTDCFNESGVLMPCPRTGQDGELQKGVEWPSPRFGVNGDCVTDNLTGLMWDRNPDNSIRNWQQALDYANSLNLCGYIGWRLPNLNELESLINAKESSTAGWMASQGFAVLSWGFYWTSTPYVPPYPGYDVYAWSVFLVDGQVEPTKEVYSLHTLPVRGVAMLPAQVWQTGLKRCYEDYTYPLKEISCTGTGQDGELQQGAEWPSPRFGVNGECVTDNLTGLMWVRNPDSTERRWQGALDYANNLPLCGYTDWRLPNRKEARTLINYGEVDNSDWLNSQGFTNVPKGYYWTSTTWAWNKKDACLVQIQDGKVYCSGGFKDLSYSVFKAWPVRGESVRDQQFDDVPSEYWAYDYIMAIYNAQITAGCSTVPLAYCPDESVTREQMAAFIIKAKFGGTFPFTATPHFADVPETNIFFKYIQKMKDEGITAGIGGGLYGPGEPVTREQMAAFIIKAKFGEIFPFTATPHFADVPATNIFFKYIQKMKDEGVTVGIGGGLYGPSHSVLREQMAVFLAKAFLGM